MKKPRLWIVECLVSESRWMPLASTANYVRNAAWATRRVLVEKSTHGQQYRVVPYEYVEPKKSK
jgi:hypothetical protein